MHYHYCKLFFFVSPGATPYRVHGRSCQRSRPPQLRARRSWRYPERSKKSYPKSTSAARAIAAADDEPLVHCALHSSGCLSRTNEMHSEAWIVSNVACRIAARFTGAQHRGCKKIQHTQDGAARKNIWREEPRMYVVVRREFFHAVSKAPCICPPSHLSVDVLGCHA